MAPTDPADDDADYDADIADEGTIGDDLGFAADPALIPPDEGDAGQVTVQ